MKTQLQEESNFEKVWFMFQETDKKFQETDKKFQETKEQIQETDKILTEKFQETDKEIRRLITLFTGQWGSLVEALVRPSSVVLFQKRGIRVEGAWDGGLKIKDKNGQVIAQFDIILENTSEIVVISVKTKGKVEDVKDFLEKLPILRNYFDKRRKKGYRIYGAIAAIKYEEEADTFAYHKGLFVLQAGSEGLVRMLNDKKFKPKEF